MYAQRCREAFPGVPVIAGGVEASLRRIAHYDYWSDTVKPSVLLTSKADLLGFGMGEDVIVEIAQERVDAATNVDARIEALKAEGRRSALFLLANTAGDLRFVAVRLDN